MTTNILTTSQELATQLLSQQNTDNLSEACEGAFRDLMWAADRSAQLQAEAAGDADPDADDNITNYRASPRAIISVLPGACRCTRCR